MGRGESRLDFESLGWFAGGRLVGAGLVLYRAIPKLKIRSLAYLPEGPDIDWLRERLPAITLDDWLNPLLAHCKSRGAFALKMGPALATRRWQAGTIKAAIAERAAGSPNPRPVLVMSSPTGIRRGPCR